MSAFRIGVDLGGTKIEAAALDRSGAVRLRHRVATPAGDYHGTIAAIASLVGLIDHQLAINAPVGIGIPGTIAPETGLVKNANSTWLIGRPFDRDVAAALGRPVRCANDANCFALSEATDGAGAAAASVFGVILGTGVGGGVVIGGKIHVGANAIAGEWGHNPLPWPKTDELPGVACYCGRRLCLETVLSGGGLRRDHRASGGDDVAAREIAAAAERGDPRCRATLVRYADRLARGLATVINLLDPEVIVLGGGLSAIASLYRDVPRLWTQFVFSDRVATRLLPPVHGDSSGVRGAAWLWPFAADR